MGVTYWWAHLSSSSSSSIKDVISWDYCAMKGDITLSAEIFANICFCLWSQSSKIFILACPKLLLKQRGREAAMPYKVMSVSLASPPLRVWSCLPRIICCNKQISCCNEFVWLHRYFRNTVLISCSKGGWVNGASLFDYIQLMKPCSLGKP